MSRSPSQKVQTSFLKNRRNSSRVLPRRQTAACSLGLRKRKGKGSLATEHWRKAPAPVILSLLYITPH